MRAEIQVPDTRFREAFLIKKELLVIPQINAIKAE